MKTSHHDKSIPSGERADAGSYECVSCGYVLKLNKAEELPPCPKDEGLHAIEAWRPIESPDECDPTLPNSPNKPR